MSNLLLTVPELDWYDDLDPLAGELTSDLAALVQDVYHQLLEVPGSNLDDPTRGIGVEEMLNGSAVQIAAVTGRIEQKLADDDRIDGVTATLTKSTARNGEASFLLVISIEVNASVVPLQYEYTATKGLVQL